MSFVSFVLNIVFGDKQFCQKDLHRGRDCESGLSRHPEAHGLCGVLQRCLAGPYWNCPLSLFPVAGMLKLSVVTMQSIHAKLQLIGNYSFFHSASWPVSFGRDCHRHPHFSTQRNHSKEKKQASGKNAVAGNTLHFCFTCPDIWYVRSGCRSWFRYGWRAVCVFGLDGTFPFVLLMSTPHNLFEEWWKERVGKGRHHF